MEKDGLYNSGQVISLDLSFSLYKRGNKYISHTILSDFNRLTGPIFTTILRTCKILKKCQLFIIQLKEK